MYITTDMVESSKFALLEVKYHVSGVPHTVINEEHSIVGAQLEMKFAHATLKPISK